MPPSLWWLLTPESLALGRYPLARTLSLDDARQLYSATATPVLVERLDRRSPFEWWMNRVEAGSLTLTTTWYRSGVRASSAGSLDGYFLAFACAGHGESAQGSRSVPLVAGGAGMLTSPSAAPVCRLEAGYQGIQVRIPRLALESALSSLLGDGPRPELCFEPLLVAPSGAAEGTASLVRFMIDDLDRGGAAMSSPIVAQRLIEAILFHLLLKQPHSCSHLLNAKPAPCSRSYVRRIEEYLAANAARPITLTELAALTGMSVRTIHASFRRYHGCSPLAFLRERRFELARRRLLSGDPSPVTTVALDSGFEHLGRFSVEYRSRYGESPSDTLRRCSQR